MKKILIVIVVLFTLVGCSEKQETQKIVDEDPLIMHVNAKNHVEFFLVKEGTPVEDFHPEELIEVEINKDVPYEVAWVGERYAYQFDSLEPIYNLSNENNEDIEQSKKDTLDCEGFRPISIYISFDHNGRKITKRVDTILLVAPEKLYNDLQEQYPDLTRIEDAYREIINLGEKKYGTYKHYSNTEKETKKSVAEFQNGVSKEQWSTGSRIKDIIIEDGYVSNIADDYDY